MKYRIEIPEPCHEDWDKMTPQDKGRHCDVCDKVVMDFSKYSKRDIDSFVKSYNGGDICGRISDEYLGVDLVESKTKRGFRFNRLMATAVNLLALTVTPIAEARDIHVTTFFDQNQKPGVGIGSKPYKKSGGMQIIIKRKIVFQVVGSDRKPISDVSIFIKGATNDVKTDSEGKWVWTINIEGTIKKLCFTFSKKGFVIQDIELDLGEDNYEIVLERDNLTTEDTNIKKQ